MSNINHILEKLYVFFFIFIKNIFYFTKTNSNLKLNKLSYKIFKNKYSFLLKNKIFFILDLLLLFYYSKIFFYFNFFNSRKFINYKFRQTNLNYFNKELKNFDFLFVFLSGLSYFWKLIRFWFLGLILGFFSFYYLTYIRLLPINKVIFEWFLITMFTYWLLSGFVFFIKKYQYSKYTSVIQRFWKRSYILFWVLETFLFLIYFYLTLNASEEPVYMYDQLKVYKTHFFSWRFFILKLVPVISLIIFTYYLQLSLKWSLYNKQNTVTLLITIILLYVVWLEFYQFFHIINFFGNLNWVFDYDEFLWNLELEFRRTRLSNNYISICLIAKFWHLIFIFIFWIFFVLRINEINRIRYPLLAANYQNFIILYILTWLYMYPWFKYIFRNFLDNTFFWFMTNNRTLYLRVFFNDFKLFFISLIYYFFNFDILNNFSFSSFFYFNESSSILSYNQFKKHFLRDYIINLINK